ncbi:MAG: hypothetical protein A2010_03225 [Nitrospirae bacterium GWD2_57_9]|nr:MAG: hypothetical protein A2010_03225 [Nitrospirae bacterium GWD2_57_9]
MAEKKAELIKSVMINLGILLILVSAIAAKELGVSFYLGLILLAFQTFDFKGIEPRKLIVAEIIIASALSIATITLLIMSKSFGTPQVFMIILLLGAILVTIEAVRKYADL